MHNSVLTRQEFRNAVFKRDKHCCVICGQTDNIDAHHIIERRLFAETGGYFLDNGATLCPEHHIKAEQTVLSVEDIRNSANITNIILPDGFYKGELIDKWGNPILPNNMRMQGPLFNDVSVQKILKEGNVLSIFTKYVKYPRTFHLPWSPGKTNNDRALTTIDHFHGKQIVVTVKMDGENCSLYNDNLHARSLCNRSHPSRSWIKAKHAAIAHDIPEGWRICGENVYACHSIHYKNLSDYFLMFSIWNESNVCLSWKNTAEWAYLLGLELVPVLYLGEWNEQLIRNLYQPSYQEDECEGYVVRLADEFCYNDFSISVAKFVRSFHVQTQGFWTSAMIKNQIKNYEN